MNILQIYEYVFFSEYFRYGNSIFTEKSKGLPRAQPPGALFGRILLYNVQWLVRYTQLYAGQVEKLYAGQIISLNEQLRRTVLPQIYSNYTHCS